MNAINFPAQNLGRILPANDAADDRPREVLGRIQRNMKYRGQFTFDIGRPAGRRAP
jgi:hypothetical protein